MLLFKFALKNLFRHKNRTIITALSIGIGIALLIIVDSLLEWTNDFSIRNLINYGLDFNFMDNIDIGYRIGYIIYGVWNTEMMLTGFLFGIISSVVVSLYPSYKVLKMNIIKMLYSK